MIDEIQYYEIVRYYHLSQKRDSEVIESNLTLEEAQEHCADPSTHVEGEYFDGYRLQ